MTRRQKNFLRRLADLIEQHDAGMRYTAADDGIHIMVDGSEVFSGTLSNLYISSAEVAKSLREAAK